MASVVLSGSEVSTPPPATHINFNFDQVDVRFLVKLAGDVTGKKFILDQAVEGKVTLITHAKIPADEVYPFLLSVLDASGFAVIEQNGLYRVIAREARSVPVAPVIDSETETFGSGLITKIISVRHVNATDLRRILEPMVDGGKTGSLNAFESTNHLIITDTAANVRRLELIIAQIDKPGAARVIEHYPLTNALAVNLADELNQAVSGLRSRTVTEGEKIRQRLARGEGLDATLSDVVAVPAPHSNSLILAGTPSQVAQLKDLILKLDVATKAVYGNLQAIFLKYQSAEEIAKSLTALLSRNAEKNTDRQVIAIEANLANNALMVDAAPQDFEMVKHLVETLDLPPPQVLVEVMIAELTMGEGHDYGVEFMSSAAPKQGSTVIVGGSRTDLAEDTLLADVLSGIVPYGLSFGVADGTYTDAQGNVVPSFPFLMNLNAFKYDSNFKILSNVPLWAQNNQEASVTIGKNIPVLKSTIEGGSGTARDVIENIERLDVGIKLKVTPQVNPNNEVCLQLNPSIEAIVESSSDGKAFTPTIARREVSTTLTVPSGQTVAISGLIREDLVETERRIPFLGAIPLVGVFFRNSVKDYERSNLIIFVTPTVVRTREESEALTSRWREQTIGNSLSNSVLESLSEPVTHQTD